MKYFAKYWILKHKYDELYDKYLELIRLIDNDVWKGVIDE